MHAYAHMYMHTYIHNMYVDTFPRLKSCPKWHEGVEKVITYKIH